MTSVCHCLWPSEELARCGRGAGHFQREAREPEGFAEPSARFITLNIVHGNFNFSSLLITRIAGLDSPVVLSSGFVHRHRYIMSHLKAKAVQNVQRKAIVMRWKFSKSGATVGLKPLNITLSTLVAPHTCLSWVSTLFVVIVPTLLEIECLPGLLASLLMYFAEHDWTCLWIHTPFFFLSNMVALRHKIWWPFIVDLFGKSGGPP